jgi:hypothetical protein
MFYVRVAKSEVSGKRPITIVLEENGMWLYDSKANLDGIRTSYDGDQDIYERFRDRNTGRF